VGSMVVALASMVVAQASMASTAGAISAPQGPLSMWAVARRPGCQASQQYADATSQTAATQQATGLSIPGPGPSQLLVTRGVKKHF
jgi:hypothetical protein